MKIFIFITALFLPLLAHSGEYVVFSVKTDFPMNDSQKMYRDVYVNMGTNQGIKAGSTLDAYRVMTTVDEINQKMGRNFSFKYAKLKVIQAENDMAVARVVEFLSPENTPTGTYTNVMVGDQVEVAKK